MNRVVCDPKDERLMQGRWGTLIWREERRVGNKEGTERRNRKKVEEKGNKAREKEWKERKNGRKERRGKGVGR